VLTRSALSILHTINPARRRGGVAVLTNRELFEFAVDPNITSDNEGAVLEALQERAAR
jgi:hypothetical protein